MLSVLQEAIRSEWSRFGLPRPPRQITFLQSGALTESMNRIVAYLFVDGAHRPTLLAKAYRNPADAALLREEFARMRTVYARMRDCPVPLMPRPLALLAIGADLVLVEECLAGRRPDQILREVRAELRPSLCRHYGDLVFDWLARFQRATAGRGEAGLVPVAEALGCVLDRVERLVSLREPERQVLDRLRESLPGRFGSRRIRLVAQHGDLSLSNMLAIDWTFTERAVLPFWDLFYVMRSLHLLADPEAGEERWARAFLDPGRDDPPMQRALDHVRALFPEFDVRPDDFASIFRYFVVRRLARECEVYGRHDQRDHRWRVFFNRTLVEPPGGPPEAGWPASGPSSSTLTARSAGPAREDRHV